MNFKKLFFFYCSIFFSVASYAQLGESFDLERPEKYQDRKIGYEKTYTKKFGLPRKFMQNTISHYNFFFNANEKIKEVIARATEAKKDTFDRLLTYYPYLLDQTKTQQQDLDSVIQKASGGILIHDLRSNWVDNFYLLIGKSYLLQQKYDSAEMTFNYINYEFAPKTKDKDRILTGSNDTENKEHSAFSIATKEKKSITSKLLERPPSRNESFLWMLRTHIENEDFGSASGIAQTLKYDPLFPKRLHNDLDELIGYLFYKQQVYDSAAHYLMKSISIADGKNDRARREFLAGQLYELGKDAKNATAAFNSSIKHTLDPVMEVYARLYSIKLNKGTDPKIVEDNIAALIKMAKKDAYYDYKDIIYYFAGKMEEERNNMTGATDNYLKSAQNATRNIVQKNKTYLALAEIAYKGKKYADASNYYDSLNVADPSITNVQDIELKKTNLKKLVSLIDYVNTEDSLQQVAAMPEAEREDYLKKLLRRLRKEQGLKDDANYMGAAVSNINLNNSAPNLFDVTQGEWYFYNNNSKNRGNAEFKNKWGNRPNIDNWRRASSIGLSNVNNNNRNNSSTALDTTNKKKVKDLTMDGLTSNLPISAIQLKISNDSIQSKLLQTAKVYHFELEDVPSAIEAYENLIKRYPNHPNMDEIIFNLYLAHTKIGNTEKAKLYKNTLSTQFKDSKHSKELNSSSKPNATKAYNEIYDLFISGQFEKALALKKVADSIYGDNNWTPQLLYIQGIYYVQKRQDSIALETFKQLNKLFPTSPLFQKVENLITIIPKRAAIEKELNELNITRAEEAPIKIDAPKVVAPVVKPTVQNTPVIVTNTKPIQPTTTITNKPKDSVKVAATPAKPIPPKYPYVTENESETYVGIVLYKVDNIFTNEARNAFVIYNRSQPKTFRIDNTPIDTDHKILLIQSFANATEALNYITNVKAKATTEIVPWLAKEKYSFIILNAKNLKLVQEKKDLTNYKNYLEETYPGKF